MFWLISFETCDDNKVNNTVGDDSSIIGYGGGGVSLFISDDWSIAIIG